MEINKSQRGFGIGEFKDLNSQKCSIQQSSLATEDAIWLGIDNPDLTIFEDDSHGRYINTQMPNNFSPASSILLLD